MSELKLFSIFQLCPCRWQITSTCIMYLTFSTPECEHDHILCPMNAENRFIKLSITLSTKVSTLKNLNLKGNITVHFFHRQELAHAEINVMRLTQPKAIHILWKVRNEFGIKIYFKANYISLMLGFASLSVAAIVQLSQI